MNTNNHYTYAAATPAQITRLWDKDIARHAGDAQWQSWKPVYQKLNEDGLCQTFAVLCDGEPVGQGTLLFSPECGAIAGRTQLADGKTTTNINALRIEKAHEGQGHISQLVKVMERYAREHGYRAVTIGVEPKEARNLGIYLHWGYTDFLFAAEEPEGLVLYYQKTVEG